MLGATTFCIQMGFKKKKKKLKKILKNFLYFSECEGLKILMLMNVPLPRTESLMGIMPKWKFN